MANSTFQKMHLLKKINNHLLIIVIIIAITQSQSCNQKNKTGNSYEKSATDTLYYKLSKAASDTLDILIGSDSIPYIYLISNSNENQYHFSFPLVQSLNRSEKRNYLLHNSNRYLITSRDTIIIYSEEDLLFSISPKDSLNYISHYPTAGITVNAKGELVDYFSERYRLK